MSAAHDSSSAASVSAVSSSSSLSSVQSLRRSHLESRISSLRHRIHSVALSAPVEIDDFGLVAEAEEANANPYANPSRLPIPANSGLSGPGPASDDESISRASVDGSSVASSLTLFARLRRYRLISGPICLYNIMSSEFCERFGYYAMRSILVLFLQRGLGWSANASTMAFSASASVAYSAPVFGGYLADSFLGQYKTIVIFSFVYIIGAAMLAMSAALSSTWLCILALFIIGIGTGGIKPCVSGFGASQYSNPALPPRSPADRLREVGSFFSIFYICINGGSVLSTIITPIVRSKFNYAVAFAVPAILLTIATIIFLLGTPNYYKIPPAGSLMPKVISCVGRGIMNSIRLRLGLKSAVGDPAAHWLDRIRTSSSDDQVENAKILVQICRVFAPMCLFWSLHDQESSVWVQQAALMDCGPILPESLQSINPIEIVILLPVFDKFIYPALGPRFTPLARIGTGIIFTVASFLCSFTVQWSVDHAPPNSISVFWQIPQITLMVIAELLISVTGLEFAYTRAPKELKSTIGSVFFLTNAIGNLITVIAIGSLSKSLDHQSLILVFALLMALNFIVYLILIQGVTLEPQLILEKRRATAIAMAAAQNSQNQSQNQNQQPIQSQPSPNHGDQSVELHHRPADSNHGNHGTAENSQPES